MKNVILFSHLPNSGWWKKGTPKHENNWAMEIGRIPDQLRLKSEHENCLNVLSKHTELEVKAFPIDLDHDNFYRHDAIFTRDSFISNQKGKIVISNFKDSQRHAEAKAMKKYLSNKKLVQIHLSDSAYAEGGEFYYSPKDDILFAGTSRNNKLGVIETAKFLHIKTVCIVVSKAFHLDTIFTILIDKKGKLSGVIACMQLIENKAEVMKFIKKHHLKLIEIDPIDSIDYNGKGKISVNCLALPGKLITGNKFHTQGVQSKIKSLQIDLIVTPITQFLYSGGGVHCLTNELAYESN